jgi:hypothetical protein
MFKAALMQNEYTDPVSKLLKHERYELQDIDQPWSDYLALGLTDQHVPDLIRMALDDELHIARQDSLEVWGPVHAWRTLGQLRTLDAVKPLLRLFDKLEDDAWIPRDLPKVFSLIGPASIPGIAEFLADASVEEFKRISVPGCLKQIGQDHPDHYDECVKVLVDQLSTHNINGPTLNAFLIVSLTDLKATTAIDEIRKAYLGDNVDLTVQGDVEDVEIELGLRLDRATPPPNVSLIPGLPPIDQYVEGPDSPQTDRATNLFKHVGRNDPCPCGSGKKFKKCCLN